MIVVDASFMIEWLFGTGEDSRVAQVHDALAHAPILVPAHWPSEMANAMIPDIRKKRLSPADFETIMSRFDPLDLRYEQAIDADEIGPLAVFAMTYELTAYDAAYVQLALRQRAVLATLDGEMRRAATQLNIALLPA